jgi:hypothetical protein
MRFLLYALMCGIVSGFAAKAFVDHNFVALSINVTALVIWLVNVKNANDDEAK